MFFQKANLWSFADRKLLIYREDLTFSLIYVIRVRARA